MFGAPIFLTLLIISCGYAMLKGTRDARIVAASCIVATVATRFAIAPLEHRYVGIETGLLLIDLVVLAVFVAVALRSDRFWPLWVAGLQLTTAIAHVLKGVKLDLIPVAYGAALSFWSYPILLILAVATWRGHRRMTAGGRQRLMAG